MTFFKKIDFPRRFILYKKGLQLSLQVFLSFSRNLGARVCAA